MSEFILPKRDYSYPVSRDWGLPNFKCKRLACIANGNTGKCKIPSRCVIGEDGNCEGFKQFHSEKSKDKSTDQKPRAIILDDEEDK